MEMKTSSSSISRTVRTIEHGTNVYVCISDLLILLLCAGNNCSVQSVIDMLERAQK